MQVVLYNMANDIAWKAKKAKRHELKNHVWRFLLYPQFWIDPSKHIATPLSWNQIKFNETNSSAIPTSNGIYCFVVIPPTPNLFETRYLFYIGKASSASLRSRYKEYIDEMNDIGIGKQKPRIKVQEMLNEYYDHIYFFYAPISNATVVIDSEKKLLNTFFPYVNTLIPEATISEEYKHIY